MCQKYMMINLIERLIIVNLSWRMHACLPAKSGKYILLIHDDPMLDTISKMFK